MTAGRLAGEARGGTEPTYVGPEACGKCHTEQYANYRAYAKKSLSFEGVSKMKKGLSDEEVRECFKCHTTGYGKSGGFRSVEETPHLKEASCEACHGPGSVHVETQDPKDIKGTLTTKDCEVCHNAERVAAFSYKPLIFGGAH